MVVMNLGLVNMRAGMRQPRESPVDVRPDSQWFRYLLPLLPTHLGQGTRETSTWFFPTQLTTTFRTVK